MKFKQLLAALVCLSPICASAEVGQVVPNFELSDYRGKEWSLRDFDDSSLVVLAFMGTECPLAKLYSGRLQELSQKYDSKQLTVIAINSNLQDNLTEITAWAQRHGVTFPVLKDPAQKVADLVGAERTPQVFLLDQKRIVRYEGRIDDQYVIGVVRDAPTRSDLKLAIDQLLSGESVAVSTTEAIGCLIARQNKPNENSQVTYSNQIARIFQNRCVECHRDGEIGPFTLTSYEDVIGWGPMIAEVVRDQRMPPWHADPAHGEFANDRSLTQEEKNLIFEWVKNGSPEGDPKDLPAPVEYVAGWQLAEEPDVVFEMREKPFEVAADAGPRGIPYQNFWVETGFTEDKWVVGAEAKPGNRAVVHHIVVYLHPQGKHTREHSFFCAYVPGLRLHELPEGVAKKIPAGSALRFEMHYTPVGTVQEDLSSVGFVFADPETVEREIITMHVGNSSFKIQPYGDNQSFTARSGPSPEGLELLSLSPHMHLRGKAFKYEAMYPDGTSEVLLDVPHYDFNWQTQYRLTEPRRVPAGTRLLCTATYDNSEGNLANPDPSATVTWGDQSWDEMFLGYYDVILPSKSDSDAAGKNVPAELLNVDLILKRGDKDNDGKITENEADSLPLLKKAFKQIDLDKNGAITENELTKVVEYLKSQRGI